MPFALSRRIVSLLAIVLALLPRATAAQGKPHAVVSAVWLGAPPTATLGQDMTLTLRVSATTTSEVEVEILPTAGVDLVSSASTWRGRVGNGRPVEIPVTIRVVNAGDWTLGARATTRGDRLEVAGAVLGIVADGGGVRLGAGAPDTVRASLRAQAAVSARVGAVAPATVAAGRSVVGPRIQATVSGTATWVDPEGLVWPVRSALVEVTDAAGALIVRTGTNESGQYSAALDATQIRVSVFTEDRDRNKVAVFPPGAPATRYALQSALTAVTAGAMTIDLRSERPVRGAPGAPSTDSLTARAFSVFDAMATYWAQGSALIGRDHQRAMVNFPDTAQCNTSCYSSGTEQMYILREDAFDWDVTGHEFFHFMTDRSASRSIDDNPGGPHSGGSAIGQNGRNRDQGMLLAWSEGLATAMPLLLQQAPVAPRGFPAMLNIGDVSYHDTEDATLTTNAETPPSSDGFGSENSVLGVLWDLVDTAADSSGSATDNFTGATVPLLWGALDAWLATCAPCNRVDRFWVGLKDLFGTFHPTTFTLAEVFALNSMAPRTTAPADGASVSGSAPPTFQWVRNGDPAAAHRNDTFYLVFSRDDFQGHIVPIAVGGDVTSYTPSDGEWATVTAGGQAAQAYKWFVAAARSDAPGIPSGWYWYSDVRTVQPRTLEVVLSWSPLGADVDLHLANPSGTDIAYYNRTTSWGFLDRDCITTCTQEIISVTGLPLSGAYELFAHYYSDHGRGPATVRAVVRSGSQVLSDQTFVLSTTGARRTIAAFNIGSDGPVVTSSADQREQLLPPSALPAKPPQ